MKPRNKFIAYIGALWEGSDDKPSYRRMAQLVFILLIGFTVYKGQVLNQWGFYSLIVLCTTFLLLAAIITAQQIIECLKGVNSLASLFKGKSEAAPSSTTES